MKTFFILIFTFYFLSKGFFAYSQGCSDAGVCSAGALSIIGFKYEILPVEINTMSKMMVEDAELKIDLMAGKDTLHRQKEENKEQSIHVKEAGKDTLPALTTGKEQDVKIASPDSTATQVTHTYYKYPKYYFQFTTYYGIGDHGTTIITPQLEGTIRVIKQKLFAQIKLPYTFTNGNLAKIHGWSDITMSISYIAFQKKKADLILTGGVKIPSNNANILNDTLPLPMVYQTSLGSTDILIGAKYKYKRWDYTIGYQHAFNANGNQYLHLSSVDANTTYNSYFESNKMKRADDGIFRISRNFQFKKSIASTGLLFIYHLKNDALTNAEGKRVKAPGSQGLTLNLNFAGAIPVSKKAEVTFIIAKPVITRKARPDGLTRTMVAILGLKYVI